MLVIKTFGGLQLALDGAPVTGLASRKAEALLVYLACVRRPQPRETLATLLWDDRPQQRSLANLSVLLTSLRRQLASFVTITRQTIAFNPDSPCRLDVAELETHLSAWHAHAGRADHPPRDVAAQLEKALALYAGDFLEGFYLRGSRGFEEWLVMERERLQRLAVEALHAGVTFALDHGDYPAGRRHVARLLQLDPLQEAAHRQLMLLLARSGQRSAALAQYEACRRILADELGVEPASETTALRERIHAAGTDRPQPLPVPLTPFVGRETELAHIAERLADPACRLLTLVGPGGIGKTRLALQAAAEHAEAFLNGVCFVSLASVDSAERLAPTLAHALQIPLAERADPKTQLFNYLREKELLLALDNFEHLLDGATFLVEVLQHAPHLKILITSRERLKLRAEWLCDVEGLAYPRSETAEDLDGYSAVALFQQCAGRVRADFSLAENRACVARICRLTEGMPLAIELAAAGVRTFPCETLAAEIARNLDFLATSMRDLPERHRSLRAVFEHSWRLLSEADREVFRQLAVFRGGFRHEAAAEVAGATPGSLAALVDRSMLRETSSGRYELHELLRQYAGEKLRETSGAQDAANGRHCAYYAGFLWLKQDELKGGNQTAGLGQIGEEIDNVRAAWRWAVERRHLAQIDQCLEGLFWFYMMRSWFQEGEEAFGKAVACASEAQDKPARLILAKVMTRQAIFCRSLAAYEKARRLSQESLAILGELGERGELAFVFNHLGNMARTQGAYLEARQQLHTGFELCRETEDQAGMADCLNSLGNVAYQLSDYAESKRCLQESLALRRALGDRYGMSKVLMNLGNVAYRLGEYAEARRLHQESLSIGKEIGDRLGIAACLNNLGNVANKIGEHAEAGRLYQASLDIKRNLGDRIGIAISLDNLGIVALGLGEYAEARRLRQESLALRREIGDVWGAANSLNGLGAVACALGDYTDARDRFDEALRLALEIHAALLIEEALVGIATLRAREPAGRLPALELAVMFQHRPAGDLEIQEKAERLFAELQPEFSAEAITAAVEKMKTCSLEEVASEIAREKS